MNCFRLSAITNIAERKKITWRETSKNDDETAKTNKNFLSFFLLPIKSESLSRKCLYWSNVEILLKDIQPWAPMFG